MERAPCSRKDCRNLATRYPKVLIWAKVDVHHERGAIEMCLPMPICREHQADFDIANHFIDETRQRITDAMRAMRRADPDFDSMEVEWAHIGDSLWRMIADGRGKPN